MLGSDRQTDRIMWRADPMTAETLSRAFK
jgi:hypothetical protein